MAYRQPIPTTYPMAQPPMSTAGPQQEALNILHINEAERNKNLNSNQNGAASNNKTDRVSFIQSESIQKMLAEMGLPHNVDIATARFYHHVCRMYVKNVFDLAIDYANQRESHSIEMSDVLRAMKKYSSVPPNEWKHVKLNANTSARYKKARINASIMHRRKLNIARKQQKMMDKDLHKK